MTKATASSLEAELRTHLIRYARKLRATSFACTYPGAHSGMIRRLRSLLADGETLEARLNKVLGRDHVAVGDEARPDLWAELSIVQVFDQAALKLIEQTDDLSTCCAPIVAVRNAAEDALWALDNEVLYHQD